MVGILKVQGGPPTSYKWTYNKWATGVITPISGVMTPFITSRGPPCSSLCVFCKLSSGWKLMQHIAHVHHKVVGKTKWGFLDVERCWSYNQDRFTNYILSWYLENLVYHFFRQLWLVLGVKLMEINSNWFSRYVFSLPLPVINEVISPCKWPYKWVTGVITLLISTYRRYRYNPIYNSHRIHVWYICLHLP